MQFAQAKTVSPRKTEFIFVSNCNNYITLMRTPATKAIQQTLTMKE